MQTRWHPATLRHTDNRIPWRLAMEVTRLLPAREFGHFVTTDGPAPPLNDPCSWFRLFRQRKAQLSELVRERVLGLDLRAAPARVLGEDQADLNVSK